jgi:anti-sigma factor RsiW
MAPCPSDETLSRLLADDLSVAERDALARHVEGCAACQEKLAGLSGMIATESWRRAAHPSQTSEAEEAIVRRLKQLPPSSVPTHLMRRARPADPPPPRRGGRPGTGRCRVADGPRL